MRMRIFAEVDSPPHMPKAITKALYRPCERKHEPVSATKIIGDYTTDHDYEVACVKPEKLLPRIFRPPMLLNLLDEAATEQGFINHMDDIGSDHEPEREDQRKAHAVVASHSLTFAITNVTLPPNISSQEPMKSHSIPQLNVPTFRCRNKSSLWSGI